MFVGVKMEMPQLKNPSHCCQFPELEYWKPVLITDEKGIY